MKNLDKLSFETAINIYNNKRIKNDKLKIEIEKAIGTLASQGPFATYLFLKKELDSVNESLKKIIEEILQEKFNSMEDALLKISDDLNKLLIVKQCIEQTFVYLRYRLKGD